MEGLHGEIGLHDLFAIEVGSPLGYGEGEALSSLGPPGDADASHLSEDSHGLEREELGVPGPHTHHIEPTDHGLFSPVMMKTGLRAAMRRFPASGLDRAMETSDTPT